MKNIYLLIVYSLLLMTVPIHAQQYADDIDRDENEVSGYFVAHDHEILYPTIIVYPNPTKDILRIRLPDYRGNEINVAILNQSGKVLVWEEFFNLSTIDTEIEISVDDLPPGTYFLKVEHDNMLDSKRVVIE